MVERHLERLDSLAISTSRPSPQSRPSPWTFALDPRHVMVRGALALLALLSVVLVAVAGAVIGLALGRRLEEEAAIEMW
jgi:hypothetical protein